MNTPVSFELAKLLKEKGFGKWTGDIKTTDYCVAKYFHKKPSGYNLQNWKETDVLYISGYDNWVNEYPFCEIWTYAPTIAEVVMWLYEKYGIWIGVEASDDFTMFCFRVRKKEVSRLSFDYNSPTEAYEAAIKYTLKNLL